MPDSLLDVLNTLARGDRSDLAALLHDVEVNAQVGGTKVTCHCHCLKLDASGRPRAEELAKAIAEHATAFAIPRSKIASARDHLIRTGSPNQVNALYDQAKALFTDIASSGEGGELLLFVLAETILRIPQLMCKMSLKTNPRMHVHGADGVHASVDPDTQRLALYWGESKLYADPTAAIRECLASIAPMLISAGPDAANSRDLQLLDRAIDLDDQNLEAALRRYLDPRDPLFLSLELRGICLVGFDSNAYGSHSVQDQLARAIFAELPSWKENIVRRIGVENLSDFSLHFFCVPFPSAEEFRRVMRKYLGVDNVAP